jgi:DNA-3-methyladenine glycosylase
MIKFNPLPRSFYESSAEAVGPLLLGHWLIRNTSRGPVGGPIVETEAYLTDDPACHAAPGLTKRNRVMFGPPGYAYVYFIYGCHFCVNAVCQPAGIAEAVLIRAIEPAFGQDFMYRHRNVREQNYLTNGPGKLCQALDIERVLDGVDLCAACSPLMIANNPQVASFRDQRGPIITSKRVGISKAAHLPLRFYLTQSSSISQKASKQLVV